MSIGIYLHIPFCIRKCPYCDFYSLPLCDTTADAYLEAALRQISSFPVESVDSVYFGGGTPSLFGAERLMRLLYGVRNHFSLSEDCEITLEANPAACSKEELSALFRGGFNRLSVGVQSLVDTELQALGRMHSARDALEILEQAGEAGFCNLSADLMLGIPHQTVESAVCSAERLCGCGITHLSSYLLKRMEGTPFGDHAPDGLPSEDAAADLYEAACTAAVRFGLLQYEISNFAAPGFESRHNRKYWNCEEYLGVGPAAHSLYRKVRYSTPPDLMAYLEYWAVPHGDPFAAMRVEGYSDAAEYLMLRLRTAEGLSLDVWETRFGGRIPPEKLPFLRACEQNGLLHLTDSVLRLTEKGFLVSNSILSELI